MYRALGNPAQIVLIPVSNFLEFTIAISFHACYIFISQQVFKIAFDYGTDGLVPKQGVNN